MCLGQENNEVQVVTNSVGVVHGSKRDRVRF